MDDLVATVETIVVIVNMEDIPLSCVEHSSLQACVYYSWVRFRENESPVHMTYR
jgi:hypothetical protein